MSSAQHSSRSETLHGHGVFVERPWELLAVGPAPFVRRVAGLGADWIALKLASDAHRWAPEPSVERIRNCVAPLRRRGIAVWGWGRVSGAAPATEAGLAVESIQRYGLDGWIFETGATFPFDIAGNYVDHARAESRGAGVAFYVACLGAERQRCLDALGGATETLLFAVDGAGEVGLSLARSPGPAARRIPVLRIPEAWSRRSSSDRAAALLGGFLLARRDEMGDTAVASLDRVLRYPDCEDWLAEWRKAAGSRQGRPLDR